MEDIPFKDRVLEMPSGFSLIWPFRNQRRGTGPYELFLDNNALITSKWFFELPSTMRLGSVISPIHAYSEQWLSNPSFNENTEARIKEFIKPFQNAGVIFEKGHEIKMAQLLGQNDKESKTQWMMSYLYVVLLYRIVSSDKGDVMPRRLLRSLKDKDVPKFNGCIMLCTLAGYLKDNKGIKLIGDNKPAFSYISSFVDLHATNKNESTVDESYLRNRAGDISMWLTLPALLQNNYQQAGELVVVTQDKALKKLIFRCFPSVIHESGTMAFSFDENSFALEHSKKIWKLILENTSSISVKETTREEKFNRLSRLKIHVLEGAEESLVLEVDKVWNDWIVPGFFGEFTV
ncbi:hypothetical protein [Pseudoalteromonas sp.]|uniref:hypothetical protein n=1 Tax=Pseudoalteromonas sp. TaxID=53249 RepID=UPI003D273966